ncbi:MAG: carbohydrate ABC transporter substrate-binding protein [Bacilli bacterium]
MKKSVIMLLAVTAVAGLTTGCNPTGASGSGETSDGNVINIRCWNNEFEGRFKNYYGKIKEDLGNDTFLLNNGKKVKFNIVANDGNGYQNALDEALRNQSAAAADEKVDMFLMEADYALKYSNSDYSLDVKNSVGLTDADLSDMYDYTKTVVTDTRAGKNNALKGVSWQATPGLYAFRNDIAKELWSDYPADPLNTDTAAVKAEKTLAQSTFVQGKIDTMAKFDAVAAEAKAKNRMMLSGYDDSYRVFSNNASKSWVDASTGKVTLDQKYKDWIKSTKEYTDKGYSHKTELWDTDWAKDQGPTGNVFGFFYSTWGINFTLLGNSLADATGDKAKGNGLYGEYRVCKGPATWYWGGTWLSAAKGTDNLDDVKDIMKVLTCDSAVAEKITRETEDYTNNKSAMERIANDTTYGSAFLGGQNHVKLFKDNAASISLAPMSAYDQGCNEGIQKAMVDYFTGSATYATCITNFKNTLMGKYAELTSDSFDSSFDTL